MLVRSPTLHGWWRYLVALAAPSLAYVAQQVLWSRIPPSPYLLFYPATLVVAWWCGLLPAMISVVVASIAIAYGFLEPAESIAVTSVRDILDLGIFAAISGVMCGAVARLRTALAEARDARAAAESTALAKDEILSIVSHDLRNPLSAIALSAQSLKRDAEDPARVQQSVERIERLARTASSLVADIVDLGRADAGILELLLRTEPASKVVTDAVEAAAPQGALHRVTIVGDVAEVADAAVSCDARRVQQILSNLLGNALRVSPDGGKVVVSARPSGSAVRFQVEDDGPGMDAETQARVFERHFTGDRARGLGLGLHIAQTLVRAHGGEIGVESHPGVGSRFWFTLPLAAPERAPSRTTADFRPMPAAAPLKASTTPGRSPR